MKNPPHPGETIRELCLKPLALSVTAAAAGLGISRVSLSELLNGKNGLSPEMAYRLSKAFGSAPEFWLALQMAYDLAQARKTASRLRIKKLHRVSPLGSDN
jgi:addiction module HigA family antidote